MCSKPVEQRVSECLSVRIQMRDHGIQCKELFEKMNAFIRDGTTASGKLWIQECERYLEYRLSHKSDSFAVLRAS